MGGKKRKVYFGAVAIEEIITRYRTANRGNRIDKVVSVGIGVDLVGHGQHLLEHFFTLHRLEI